MLSSGSFLLSSKAFEYFLLTGRRRRTRGGVLLFTGSCFCCGKLFSALHCIILPRTALHRIARHTATLRGAWVGWAGGRVG